MQVSEKALEANDAFSDKLTKLVEAHTDEWAEHMPAVELVPSIGTNCLLMAIALLDRAGVSEERARTTIQGSVDTFYDTKDIRRG